MWGWAFAYAWNSGQTTSPLASVTPRSYSALRSAMTSLKSASVRSAEKLIFSAMSIGAKSARFRRLQSSALVLANGAVSCSNWLTMSGAAYSH